MNWGRICFLDKISKIFENKNKRTVNWHQQWMILLTCKCGSQIDQSLDKSEINEEIWFSSCKVSRFLNICYGDCDVRRSETVTRRIAFFPLPLIFLSSMIALAIWKHYRSSMFIFFTSSRPIMRCCFPRSAKARLQIFGGDQNCLHHNFYFPILAQPVHNGWAHTDLNLSLKEIIITSNGKKLKVKMGSSVERGTIFHNWRISLGSFYGCIQIFLAWEYTF